MNDKLKIDTLISLACDFVVNKTHIAISGIITPPIKTDGLKGLIVLVVVLLYM